MIRAVVAAFLLASFGAPATAAETPRTVVQAVRTDRAPRVDGELSDPAWAVAPPVTTFTQHDPDDGKPATQAMAVRVLYDGDAIYVGAEMSDDRRPDTRLGRRDTFFDTDSFILLLDPRHDHRSGAAFWVTASGVQVDMALYNDNYDDVSWDAVWTSATHVTDHGWTVEIRIPYSQLRFPDRPVHVWGVNFFREILHNREEDRLVNTPKNETGFVSRFADLVGIEGIHPKRELELLPYGVVRNDFDYTLDRSDPLNAQKKAGISAGLDAKYRLASDLTLTGTVNPDFGQVEVDPAVVNLTQFEQFYPEKRPFFTEGKDLFAFGQGASNNNFNFNFFQPSLFYSRRIGRPPQDAGNLDGVWTASPSETTILGAGKVTGRTASGWSMGLLDALTHRERGFSIDANGVQRSQLVEPMTNYFVFRPSKDIGSDARIGFFLTSVRRSLRPELEDLRRDAWSAGTDGYWFLHKHDWIVQWMAAATRVDGSREAIGDTQNASAHYYGRPDAGHIHFDPNRTSLSGFGGRVTVAKQTGRWRWNIQAQTYSPGFEVNDIGFMQRVDETATHIALFYVNPDQTRLFRSRNFWLAKWQHFNYDGDVISNGIGGHYSATFRNYVSAYAELFKGLKHPDDRTPRGGPRILEAPDLYMQAGMETNESARWVGSVDLTRYASDNGTLDRSVALRLRYRPKTKLNLSVSPTFNRNRGAIQYVTAVDDSLATGTYGHRYVFATIEERQFEMPIRAEWTFNAKLSFQLYMQPLIAAGDYHDFKELNRPLSLDWAVYGRDRGTIRLDSGANEYTVVPQSGAASFTFGNPDFDFRTVRASAVLRWEFRPGSALYMVWSENRHDTLSTGDFRFRRDVRDILRAPSNDVFLIKVAYWLPM